MSSKKKNRVGFQPEDGGSSLLNLHGYADNMYSSSSSSSDSSSSSSSCGSNRNSLSEKSENEEHDAANAKEGAADAPDAAELCGKCREERHKQQLISVQQARQRSFLHGSIGPYQSLLGASELRRLVPDSKLKVFLGTWNMNGKAPPSLLVDLLLPTPLRSIPDLVAIATQESDEDRNEWEVGLQETLGPGHVLFQSVSLGTLHLAVFLRRDLIWVCSDPETSSHSTRAASAFRTKGGVAIGFCVFGTSILFINCHLTAHAEKVRDRQKDVKKVFHHLDLPQSLPIRRKHKDVTNNYDVVFFCGDLNFRLDAMRDVVVDTVSRTWAVGKLSSSPPLAKPERARVCESLLLSDQLRKCITSNKCLKSFHEAPICFAPTYKYTPGTVWFDDSPKERTPSYTDRILWKHRKNQKIECDHYDSAMQIRSSDHFPVWASFQVELRAGRETVPLAGGLFNRSVYLEGMKRRAQLMNPGRADDEGATCVLQ